MRAFEVLDVLRGPGCDASLTEISKTLSLHTSTTHRILRALTDAGYAVRSSSSGRYRLGREAYLLGRAAERDFRLDATAPLLAELRDATNESVNLVVRDGGRGLVVLRYDSTHPLRFTQHTGTRLPLHCTSSGKVLLAFAGNLGQEVAALGVLEQLADATITSARELLAELAAGRTSGYAINRGERIEGVCGVAAPVLNDVGALLAAVAVQGPEVRIPRGRIERLGPAVISTANAVADLLPHRYQI